MQIVPGTVEFPTKEQPEDGGYGLKYNVAIRPDDPASPKVNHNGLINIYRSPDHGNVGYMQSLARGDRVQLVYVEKGARSYYDFVMTGDPMPVTNSPKVEAIQPRTYQPQPKVYTPLSDAETEAFIAMSMEQTEVILDIMRNVKGDSDMKLSVEDKRAIAVTAYIQANRTFSRGMVLAGHEPELFDDEVEEPTNQDTRPTVEQFNKLFRPADPNKLADVGNAFIKACSALFGVTTDNIVKVISSTSMTSELVMLDPEACFEIMNSYFEALSETGDLKAATQYAAGLVDEMAADPEEDDEPPF